jgi:hypothetical protein
LRSDRHNDGLASAELIVELVFALLCDQHALGRCDAATASQTIVQRDLGCLQHDAVTVAGVLGVDTMVIECDCDLAVGGGGGVGGFCLGNLEGFGASLRWGDVIQTSELESTRERHDAFAD